MTLAVRSHDGSSPTTGSSPVKPAKEDRLDTPTPETYENETLSSDERFARTRAAIEKKTQARRDANGKLKPMAGRRAQEVDSQAVGPAIREKGTTLDGPHYPRLRPG